MNQSVKIIRSISLLMKKPLEIILLLTKSEKNGNTMKLKHFDRCLLSRIFSINPNNLRKSMPVEREWWWSHFHSSALTKNIDRLLQILELQFQLDPRSSTWNDYLFKNVIITGRNGSGKKSIVGECCQRLWNKHLIYFKFLDCLTLKGQTDQFDGLAESFVLGRKLDNIVTSITQTMDEMIFRQPSILILDHFDDLLPNESSMTDANLILAAQKLSLCKKNLKKKSWIFFFVLYSHSRIISSNSRDSQASDHHSSSETIDEYSSNFHRRNTSIRFGNFRYRSPQCCKSFL